MKVRIKPLTQYAKNRVKQHGDTFLVKNEKNGKILLESLSETWRWTKDKMAKWAAWLGPDDVEILERIND